MEQLKTVGSQFANGISNIGDTVYEKTSNGLSTVTQGVKQGLGTIGENVSNFKENIKDSIDNFSSQKVVGATSDFLNTNSIVAKFVFLLLVIIVFLFTVNLGVKAIAYFSNVSTSQYIVNGLVTGSTLIVSTQNPVASPSTLIKRSNNQPYGLELTWSVWLYVNDLNSNKVVGTAGGSATGVSKMAGDVASFSNIFNKGNNTYSGVSGSNVVGVATVNNAPGVYVSDKTNTLRVYMDTVVSNNNFVEITNFPLKKWVNLVIRVENTILDVYVNGTITTRKICEAVPKQNYDNINICANGGFNGNLSNLIYYNYALSVFQINNLVVAGPNLTQSTAAGQALGYYSYISSMWYSSKYDV